MCRSSWESNELLFSTSKRLCSQLVSVLLLVRLLSFFMFMCYKSFFSGWRWWCLLLSSYYTSSYSSFLSPSFWWRLSTTNCIWLWARSRERERKEKEISTPNIAVHRLEEEEESSVRPLPSPTVSKCCSHARMAKIFSPFYG